MPAAITVPGVLMRERSLSWAIGAATITAGQTAAGAFPVVRLDGGGVWRAQWNELFINTPALIRCYRAIAALAENGVMPLVVPDCDRRQFPAPIVDGEPVFSYSSLPHSDEMTFSDGAGYAQTVVVAQTVGDAPLRATSLTIAVSLGGTLEAGMIFSVEHTDQGWRRYEIKTVTGDGPQPAVLIDDLANALVDDATLALVDEEELEGGGPYTVTFRPPLRGAVPSGTRIEFDNPRCVMRLAEPQSMELTLELRRVGTPSVSFVEYFYP